MNKLLVLFAVLLAGCTSHKVFYQTLIGDERIIGIALPQATSLNISAYQTFGGIKTTVKDPANIYHKYTENSSNSVFGVVNWTNSKNNEIYVVQTNQVLKIN